MDKDIQDLFKVKNREILINNLMFDLDKNIDSLLETITNIFNLEFETAKKKINAIFEDASISDKEANVTDIVVNMKEENYKDIKDFIEKKKKTLISLIERLEFTEEEMNNYYEKVFSTTKKLQDSLKEEFKEVMDNNIKKLIVLVNNSDSEELTSIRITDYIENRLYGKLDTKIHMEIMLRDNNLINKAKEVYVRYQDICSKTE